MVFAWVPPFRVPRSEVSYVSVDVLLVFRCCWIRDGSFSCEDVDNGSSFRRFLEKVVSLFAVSAGAFRARLFVGLGGSCVSTGSAGGSDGALVPRTNPN